MKIIRIHFSAAALAAALFLGGSPVPAVLAMAAEPSDGAKSPVDAKASQEKNLNPDQAEKALAANKEIVILDVRTPREFRGSRLAGAKNIDFNARNFEKELAALDKEKTYLVHCAVGGRSAKAVEKMKQMNFKSVLHLDGGLKAWEKAGKKVER
jgi:phage shock protein E